MNDPKTMEEAFNPEESAKGRWTVFVEATLVDFFKANGLEKLGAEDGNGNKVKLSMTKDNEIKVEQSSISIRY
jgi:hypothetical protein